MKWIGKRISWRDFEGKTTIVITPEKVGWQIGLFIAWLLMFTSIGIYVFFQLFQNYSNDKNLILILFLSFWCYFEFKVLKSFLWQTKGREFIKLNEQGIYIKKSIGNFGKAHVMYYQNILKFSLRNEKINSFKAVYENSFWVVGGEKYQLVDKNRTIYFGRKLEENEAKILFKIIEKRLVKYKKSN